PYKGLAPGEEDELEEERRLAYVALTRARERLFVTHAATRMLFGQLRYNRPSRFLLHLPPGDVEQLATHVPPPRFVDRPTWQAPRDHGESWRHPMSGSRDGARAPERYVDRAPGERYVDREAFDDEAPRRGVEGLARGGRGRRAR